MRCVTRRSDSTTPPTGCGGSTKRWSRNVYRGRGGSALVDLVAIVKHAIGTGDTLVPVAAQVEARYQTWLNEKARTGDRSSRQSSGGGWMRSRTISRPVWRSSGRTSKTCRSTGGADWVAFTGCSVTISIRGAGGVKREVGGVT